MYRHYRVNLMTGFLLICVAGVAKSQVLNQVTACSHESVQIICESEDEVIAVHQAMLDATSESHHCGFVFPEANISVPFMDVDNTTSDSDSRIFSIHSAVNKRCSGNYNCTLSLYDDDPRAKRWSNGKIKISYYCIKKQDLFHRCGDVMEVTSEPAHQAQSAGSEQATAALQAAASATVPTWPAPERASVSGWGYVHSSSYPRFYHGQQKCRWTLRASSGRTVKLTFLDLSIRTATSDEESCADEVTVTEGKRLLFQRCGDIDEPVVIESSGAELNVTFSVASPNMYPKRGLLIHFTASGCPTPPSPAQGYLVERNSTDAEFMCCVDHVFPDSRTRSRKITCLDGHRWSHDLPDCLDAKSLAATDGPTWFKMQQLNTTELPQQGSFAKLDITYDYVLPAVIIGVLLIGNVVIVLALLHCRRQRRTESGTSDEIVPLQEVAGGSSSKTAV